MIRLFALLIFSLLVTSCAITTGTDFTEGNGNVSLHLDGGVLYVNLKTPTLDPAKQGQISETRSYAVDESGKRYGLIIEPNEFARNYPEASYWTSDFIWLKGKDGKKKKWGHGKWTISLALESVRGVETYQAKFDFHESIITVFDLMETVKTGEF